MLVRGRREDSSAGARRIMSDQFATFFRGLEVSAPVLACTAVSKHEELKIINLNSANNAAGCSGLEEKHHNHRKVRR